MSCVGVDGAIIVHDLLCFVLFCFSLQLIVVHPQALLLEQRQVHSAVLRARCMENLVVRTVVRMATQAQAIH